jgi:trehalose 6-phosphate phosphatase
MTMQHLFSADGETALARVLHDSPLLAFDFDGTLAPIVARPGDARLSRGVAARLATLATHLPVAIVTGRSVDDVRGRLGFEPRYIVGNHGAEEAGAVHETGQAVEALSRIRTRLSQQLPVLLQAGVSVEDKGHSLALHYRLSRTREQAQQLIADLLAEPDEAVRVFGGKLVVNVVPRQAPDKADAVYALVQRSGVSCAVFAGDDLNDEPVFERAPAGWLTIRVGRDGPRSRARFFLDSPGEMALLLERMVKLLAAR